MLYNQRKDTCTKLHKRVEGPTSVSTNRVLSKVHTSGSNQFTKIEHLPFGGPFIVCEVVEPSSCTQMGCMPCPSRGVWRCLPTLWHFRGQPVHIRPSQTRPHHHRYVLQPPRIPHPYAKGDMGAPATLEDVGNETVMCLDTVASSPSPSATIQVSPPYHQRSPSFMHPGVHLHDE